MIIRRLCLLLFSMAVIHGSAQVMNIHFKNGGIINYDTNSIDHIDFTLNEDNPANPPQETGENVNKNGSPDKA